MNNTIQIAVQVIILLALAYAWYSERNRRRDAELQRDIATRRTTLDGIAKKLDEQKGDYDAALNLPPIPPHMLDLVGGPVNAGVPNKPKVPTGGGDTGGNGTPAA